MTTTSKDTGLRGLDLAVEVLAYNDAYPGVWNQGSWFDLHVESGEYTYGEHDKPSSWDEDDRFENRYGQKFLTLAGVERVLGEPCHTTGCIAGNAALLGGLAPVYQITSENGTVEWDANPMVKDHSGTVVSIAVAAAELLELPGGTDTVDVCEGDCDPDYGCSCEARSLFNGNNTRDDVVMILAAAYDLDVDELERRAAERATAMRAADHAALQARLNRGLGTRDFV